MMWEYLVQKSESARGSLGIRGGPEAEDHQDILNKLGDHEWELVSVWGERGAMYFYFKRPKVLS